MQIYLMKYYCKTTREKGESRFIASNDENAISYCEDYLREKKENFPENEYQFLELLRIKKVK